MLVGGAEMADLTGNSRLPQKFDSAFTLPKSLGLRHPRLKATRTKFLFPVIHCASLEQTYSNINSAIECDCDGVFLINHKMNFKQLFVIFKACRQQYPTLFIGLNCLDLVRFVNALIKCTC